MGQGVMAERNKRAASVVCACCMPRLFWPCIDQHGQNTHRRFPHVAGRSCKTHGSTHDGSGHASLSSTVNPLLPAEPLYSPQAYTQASTPCHRYPSLLPIYRYRQYCCSRSDLHAPRPPKQRASESTKPASRPSSPPPPLFPKPPLKTTPLPFPSSGTPHHTKSTSSPYSQSCPFSPLVKLFYGSCPTHRTHRPSRGTSYWGSTSQHRLPITQALPPRYPQRT